MIDPLISCIVPVFNGERYLAEALDSIIAQTYSTLEILIVDDGSTDGTAGVSSSYGKKVTYIWQANAGPAAARNAGLEAAQGEFVAFLDADDLWHLEKLSRQMECFLTDPGLEMCLTHMRNFWSPELIEEKERHRDPRLTEPWPSYSCCTLLARPSVFTRVGMFNPDLRVGEDGDWFMRANQQGVRLQMLPEVFVYRRLHSNNLTRREAKASREILLHRVKSLIDHRRGK